MGPWGSTLEVVPPHLRGLGLPQHLILAGSVERSGKNKCLSARLLPVLESAGHLFFQTSREWQPQRLDQDLLLATGDLLTSVVVVRPPLFGRLDRLAIQERRRRLAGRALGLPQVAPQLVQEPAHVPSFFP